MSEFKTDIGQVYRDRLLAEAEMVRNYGLALEEIQDQQQTMDRMQARIDALECCLVDITQNATFMGQTAARNAYFVDAAFINKATALLEGE